MSWLWRWLRDEDFWKQITVNVASAGIVAALAYIFAVAAGYITQPERIHPLTAGLILILMSLFAVVTMAIETYGLRLNYKGKSLPRGLVLTMRTSGVMANVLALAMLFIFVSYVGLLVGQLAD